MEKIIVSLKPKWCIRILDEVKNVEVRKNYPKRRNTTEFLALLYCTEPHTEDPHKLLEIHNWGTEKIYRGNGMIVGEMLIDRVEELPFDGTSYKMPESGNCCLTEEQLYDYGKGKKLYGWHIASVQLYEIPVPLSDFGLKRPPQSWCYVPEMPVV